MLQIGIKQGRININRNDGFAATLGISQGNPRLKGLDG